MCKPILRIGQGLALNIVVVLAQKGEYVVFLATRATHTHQTSQKQKRPFLNSKKDSFPGKYRQIL